MMYELWRKPQSTHREFYYLGRYTETELLARLNEDRLITSKYIVLVYEEVVTEIKEAVQFLEEVKYDERQEGI